MHSSSCLLELRSEQLKRIFNRVAYVDGGCLSRRSRGDSTEAPHKIVDPCNFTNDDFRKVLAEIKIGVPLRQQLRECPDSNKRILNFVCDT